MTTTSPGPPLNLSTDDVQAYTTLLAYKDRFLHELRTTGTVGHALLTQFVASVVRLRQVSAGHPERVWRLGMSELVLAHTDRLAAVPVVLDSRTMCLHR